MKGMLQDPCTRRSGSPFVFFFLGVRESVIQLYGCFSMRISSILITILHVYETFDKSERNVVLIY